jgi:class 3 adenylate cyclase
MKVDSAQGERRQITVLFADMAGHTAVSERLGEEGAYELIQAIYTILADAVRELGGTVQDFTSDGIMALFGAPTGSYSPHNAINFGQNAWQLSPYLAVTGA